MKKEKIIKNNLTSRPLITGSAASAAAYAKALWWLCRDQRMLGAQTAGPASPRITQESSDLSNIFRNYWYVSTGWVCVCKKMNSKFSRVHTHIPVRQILIYLVKLTAICGGKICKTCKILDISVVFHARETYLTRFGSGASAQSWEFHCRASTRRPLANSTLPSNPATQSSPTVPLF